MEPTGTNGRTRHIFPTLSFVVGWVSSCGGFSLDGKECCFLWSRDERSKRFVRVRCPVPGPPRSESWLVPLPADPVGVGRCIGFAVVMAQVRRPVPFRTRKLRPGRGDGTALERVWESSTPPHSTYGPSGRAPSGFPGGLFFYSRARVFSSVRWRSLDAGRPVGGRTVPVAGRFGTLRDPRNFEGASCSYPMVG